MIVSVVDYVEKLAGLREEGADFAVAPTGDDGFAVVHEKDAEALKAGNLDSQELLAIFGVPDSDLID